MKTLLVAAGVSALIVLCAGKELGAFFTKLLAPQSVMAAQSEQRHPSQSARLAKYLDTETR